MEVDRAYAVYLPCEVVLPSAVATASSSCSTIDENFSWVVAKKERRRVISKLVAASSSENDPSKD